MLTRATFKFLEDLEKNNNRDWFNANKEKYLVAKENFDEFVSELISGLSEFDPELKGTEANDCVFRIYRDIRFSKNKDPYKTNFGAYIAPGGRKSMRPGYYIHLDVFESFIAGGAYQPDSDRLLKIRKAIAARTKEFFGIINNPEFQKAYGEITPHNQKLKRVPKGFPKKHEAAEYLKFKNFIASREVKHKDFKNMKKLLADLELLKPFIDFFRKAII